MISIPPKSGATPPQLNDTPTVSNNVIMCEIDSGGLSLPSDTSSFRKATILYLRCQCICMYSVCLHVCPQYFVRMC